MVITDTDRKYWLDVYIESAFKELQSVNTLINELTGTLVKAIDTQKEIALNIQALKNTSDLLFTNKATAKS